MSENRTVVRPPAPLFKIKETVYSLVSSKKGYVEPLFIWAVEFDPARRKYLYTFVRTLHVVHPKKSDFIPAKLYEDQVCNLCGALQNQMGVLERQFNEAMETLNTKCTATGAIDFVQTPIVYEDSKFMTQPPAPRFGINDVVYLTETAQTTGALEALRINNMVWDNIRRMWTYKFIIRPRPERHMTIGDADAWHNPKVLYLFENELVTFCEAQQLVVSFLDNALTQCKIRLRSYCGATF
jgi:hypothetical protein